MSGPQGEAGRDVSLNVSIEEVQSHFYLNIKLVHLNSPCETSKQFST